MENRNIKSFVWAWTWTQMRIWEQHRTADLWFNLTSGGILPETGKRLQLCAFVKPKVQSSKLLLFTTGAGCTSTRSKSEVCGHWTSSLGIVGMAETWWNSVTASPTRWRWGLYSCGDQVQPGAGVRFDHEQISRKSCTVSKKLWCYSDPIGDPQLFGHDLTGSCLIMFGWKKSCSHFFWMVEPLEIRVNNGINMCKPPITWCRISSIHRIIMTCQVNVWRNPAGWPWAMQTRTCFQHRASLANQVFCEVIQKAVLGCWWFCHGFAMVLACFAMVLPCFAMVLPCFAMVLPCFAMFSICQSDIINENQGQMTPPMTCRICWATSDWFWKRVAGMPWRSPTSCDQDPQRCWGVN